LKIGVCDFGDQNPNVFYDAAHILGKHVIPIAQNANDVPFELRHPRYVRISRMAGACGADGASNPEVSDAPGFIVERLNHSTTVSWA